VFLFAALDNVMPGYARKFSLRAQVRPQLEVSADPGIPVVCYPHLWDSVSFYLKRNDVQAFSSSRRAELMAQLRACPNVLLFVKSDHSLQEVLASLPPSLEFVPRGKNGIITAGIVSQRPVAPDALFACR
jgi:hypothetical protein